MGTVGPVLWILSTLTFNHAFELSSRVSNPAHNDRVCSTWGNFHYKTFDGDIYQFPGPCNYLFSSNCKNTFEDFNIQIRRSVDSQKPVLSYVVIKIEGLVIEMKKGDIIVGGEHVSLPFSQFGVQIQQTSVYVKVSAKLGLTLFWNHEDSLMLELSSKYMNTTCGLCGNMNGLSQDEFQINNVLLSPVQFGNLQKFDGPTEHCEDVISSVQKNCSDLKDTCVSMLSSPAFDDCNIHLPKKSYIEACMSDLCSCQSSNDTSCFCNTLAEYSRQCAHAGGRPSNWRNKICAITCPMNLQYEECGSPCADTCSNFEQTQVCEEHCIDGCFCPPGTVFDDVHQQGCIPLSECSCTYNNTIYALGESYSTNCRNCTCQGGKWSCQDLPCAGYCSLEGGSHIYTYDGSHYNFHGQCDYIFTKDCVQNMFTVLVELTQCGVTKTESCLKSVTLSLEKGLTVVSVKSSGTVLLNGIYSSLPLFTDNLAVLQPSSFYLIIKSFIGIQIQIQLNPVMQISVSLDPEYKGDACGLCGDFNNIQTDDFRAGSGLVEGTASGFANTWKAQADCPNVKDSYDNPCSLSVENERFAQYWCSQLSDSNGIFAPCHAAVHPEIYQKNCMYDSCNYENSEDSVCAALSAYVRACAAEGVILTGWRGVVCDKYTKNCPKNSTYQYAISTCQKTCRSLSDPDPSCSFELPTVDGCACPNGTYLHDSGACVLDKQCPCYYKGSIMPPGEVVYDKGAMCTCQSGRLHCVGNTPSIAVCPDNMVYFDCANASNGGKGAECQKTCQTLDMECFSIQCAAGCVCPDGLVLSNNGSCILEEECPCVHNGEIHQSGETIQQDCNTCTCKDRKWQCTQNECHRTCVVYGEGHYVTFDGKRFDFSGDCEYTLTQDYCLSNSGNGTFRVITENIPCGTTGATCSKAIKVFLGNFELKLSEGSYEVLERDIGSEVPYQVRQMGIYLVIEATNGLILMWDKKTSILIKLSPEFKGRVCGLCGNYDGSVSNDFITRSQSVVVNIQEFGNSWKAAPTCPDALPLKDPCVTNPYRQTWSQKHCSFIMGSTFSKCHSKVDPTPYHDTCVQDTCACDSGGDCECYCTAVAAYAAACSQAGICVSWRTPEICPLFCDYYNPEGECDWHYKPCGAPCMKTCRNPSGHCMNTLPGLEGCYPKCPKERPFFDEDIMKCVAQANCGCYDDDGKRYSVGDMVPSYKNCELCICTKKGRRCQVDMRACYCYYGNMKYNYGDVIYNTTDGIGGCITATCSFNGTIARNVYPCVPTTKAPTTTFHFDTTSKIPLNISTPEQMSSTSVSCLEEVCKWSPWYDVTYPKYGIKEGDFETFDNIRNNGYSVCKVPSQVECRAKRFPKISVTDLGQKIQCNTSVGLVCYNQDQFSQLCYNYEISILCCTFVPCGESSASPTPFVTSSPDTTLITKSLKTTITTSIPPTGTLNAISSEKTTPRTSTIKSVTETVKPSTTKPQATTHNTPCQKEMCTWTPWIDVHFPSIINSDGDFETIENIRAAGNNVCSKPEDIECRAEKFPDLSIEKVGQIVTCNVTHGLICNNKDQENIFPLCYNYQIRIRCCSMEDCEASTTLAASTAKIHSTEHPTTPEFTRTTQQFTKTTVLPTTKIPLTVQQSTKYSTHITGLPTTSSKVNCEPVCEWSQWFDVSFPNSDTNGDFETYENIRNSGFTVCQEPSNIQCRSTVIPDLPLEELQQNVYCNISNGLVCRTEEQTGPFSYCYNYEIRVYCCSGCASTEGIPTSTKHSLSTTHLTTTLKAATSVPQTTKNRVTLLPTSPYESTTDFGKLTTDEDVYTYTPKKTQATVPFTEPLEKITEFTTAVNTQRPISTTVEKVSTTSNKHDSIKTTKMSEETSAYKTTPGKPITSETVYPKETTAFRKSTTEAEHNVETTSQKLVSMKTTKMSTESGEVTSAFKTTPGKPMTSETLSPKETTVYRKSTTGGEYEKSTSQKLVSMKTTKMSTESGEVTSAFKTTGKMTSAKASTSFSKPTTESEHVTSGKPIQTTKVSTESNEITSAYKTTPGKPMTSETVNPKETTTYRRSTTEAEHEETTSQKLVSVKTTKMSTESGKVTSAFKTTGKITSSKANTDLHKSTTESEHEDMTSRKPVTTAKVSTESHEVTSAYKTSPGKPMTSETLSPKETTVYMRSTTGGEHEETTSQKLVSMKTTKMSTESGEVTSAFKTTGKMTSAKASTSFSKPTTESEHMTSGKPIQTTKVSTESNEVTSAYKTTPGKPITSETMYPKETTTYRKSTTETEHEETTSQKFVSVKTTKMSTESGEVTSAFKTTGKMTSTKASTSFSKPNTESEHVTSGKPIETTKVSTESNEVTSAYKTTPGKPMTSETLSPKETTVYMRSTTGGEHEETTSQKLVSMKTTKMSTESGEVTSAFKTTGKMTSAKASTSFSKPTTESEHMTSGKPIQTTKVSTESNEVTSAYKTTPGKPMTSETLSPKETTVYMRSTTGGEHEETTSQKLVSMKTTKMSTESGEVTSAFKTTGKMTSAKASTSFSKPTTESEHMTSGKPIQTTKVSTESNEVTSAYKTTPGKPMTSETLSPKETTVYMRSTTGGEHEETTSQKLVSMKTTKMSTKSGEVTSAFKTTGKMTSAKASTSFSKPTTESEHVTSGKPIQTTKVPTESHEVTSAYKTTPGKPMTSETIYPKETTTYRRSTTEAEHEETTSQKLFSVKTTKMSTESGELTSAFKTTGKITSAKASTSFSKPNTESEHVTSGKPIQTTKVSTESHEVTSAHKTTPGKPMTSETMYPKETTTYRRSTTEAEHEETTSQKLASMKTTKMSTESGEVTSAFKTTGKITSAKASTSFSKPNTESEHVTSGKPIQTTKVSTESHEVTATSHSIFSTKSTPEGTFSTKLNSQQPSKSTHQSMYPTSGKVSTESTVTSTSRLSTATTESFSTVRCMCNINRVLVPPGQVIYNTTDNAGWCFYAKCNQNCEVERYSEQCYSSTVPTVTSSTKTSKTVTASTGTMTTKKTESTTKKAETSTKTSQTSQTKTSTSSASSTSTINPGCSALMPPRVVNETWMIDNCTQARCIGGNNIAINKKECAPIKEVVCANRLQPQKTFDDSGCCYEPECQCVCGGWGTSNYITFDGTYYSFNGQCTYVLVQQITPVFDHFRVYIDNFSCNPDDPNCVKTLRIMYKNDTFVLKSQSLIQRIFNKIYINGQRVYPAIYRNGILITTSGIYVVVEIPELGAYISFNALSFTVKLPISKFSGNTQGHCGKCSNNRIDDCILPNGQLAPSCTQMAGQWNAPSEDSTCSSIPTTAPTGIPSQSALPFSSLPPTYFSTVMSSVPHILSTRVPSTELSYLPSTSLTTKQVISSEEPCNAPEVCTLILSSVFEKCHSVVPPEPYYQACVTDGCTKSQGDILCSSLQSYARICGIQGVCLDWRNSTNGLCSMNCTSHLVYNPCGPAVERTCDSRYNDAFLNVGTKDFMEGCYCPENMTKYNAVSDKCVSTCGCTGPDGMPREPGDTWDSNCKTCRCDNTSMSVQCVEKSCALPVSENCTKEGYMPVSVPDLSNPCCLVTECRCNVSLCSNTKKDCEPGYESVLYLSPEECCPVYKCEPKDVCVHNGTEYQPGTPVISSNPCEKCMCDENMNETTGIYHVSCTPVICDKKCAQGFKYTNVPGQCCGICEQTECIMDLPDNSTHLLKPGDTWSPPGDNCTEYECIRKKDTLLTVASKISCPRINLDECVPGTIQKDPSGCCVTCMIKEKKCQNVKTENIIFQNGCKSIKPVTMSYCKGNCDSYSKYSVKSQSMEQKCVCCQETETEKISIILTCPNGKTMKYSFINVKKCSCVDTTCKTDHKQNNDEDYSGDGSQSYSKEKEVDGKDKIVPVTKQGPTISNKPMKTTRQLQEKKDNDDINRENSKENESSEQNNKSDSKEKVDKEKVSPVTKKVPGLTNKPIKTTRQLQEKKDNDDINRENSKENESSEQNNKSDSKEKVDKEKVSPVTKKVPGLTNKPIKTTRQLQEKKDNDDINRENSKENESSEQNNKSD
ncbi:mucin-5AC-like [Bufo bufo]|uniref:mucin-5AC-like n=1 Tax=Bufo bufo TaxID=8384 RepID=UPI001ABEC60E|nr:mucin-5AC-like [Bufo bufo]